MTRYAERTSGEIERTLARYGATDDVAACLAEAWERIALVNSPVVEPIPVPGDDAGNARLRLWLEDAPRLLAAVEAVLKLAGFFAAKATELDGMANRASLRGADPIRTTLLSARAQAHEGNDILDSPRRGRKPRG